MDLTADIVRTLAERGQTIAVAESLTAGALCAELTRPPGASAVVLGGVVVYATELKHRLVGVDAELLAEHGPVHADVAAQLADRVRAALTVSTGQADIGLATTGVAGPDPQGGQNPGTVFLGIATAAGVETVRLGLSGTRDQIRAQSVEQAVLLVATTIGIHGAERE